VYSENGASTTCSVDGSRAITCGNPLIANPELDALKRAHSAYLAYYGVMKIRAKRITGEHVCNIAEHLWYGMGEIVGVQGVPLHAIMVVGLNLGMRYEEIHLEPPITIRPISCSPCAILFRLTGTSGWHRA